MKKLLTISVIISFLVACSQEESIQEEIIPVSQSVATKPIYVVAIDPQYPPYSLSDKDGRIIGLDVDILNKIAEKENISFQYKPYPHNDILGNMKKEGVSLLASGIDETEVKEKQKDALVSLPYSETKKCVMELRYKSSDKWKEKRIAVLVSDLEAVKKVKNVVQNSNIIEFPSNYLALSALMKNEADSVVGDCTILNYYARNDILEKFPFSIQDINDMPEKHNIVFVAQPDSLELLSKVNNGLMELRKSGELAVIMNKWIKPSE
ncbi:transporter substrate-binding domain-containing protein [Kingella negevensis]|uniref:substrate-binding periplasmic protein n=1 Tax=Kingella negevensis TaxID=1522312 RepID=UPI00050A09F9|nr:transporter substrate-binding domain-containing protein [Kingella negevensis]MDK4708348.1 transporter substrate-binding domain-containing protein [Kingella negevensis]MDK4709184.1 transporter substrate-binding domain-containing protein [Kingella negevensis]